MKLLHALGHALAISGSMTWEILWALIFGFALSAVLQSVVRRSTIVKRLGDDRPRTLAVATGFGAASSSCSYAAVALARALFRRGASFTAAMVFEIASTNLVVELGVILAVLIGWQFTAAEFVGGPIMIVLLAVLFRLFLRQRLIDAARAQSEKGLPGSMEGHAAMDMTVSEEGSLWRRLGSRQALTSVSHIFVMEWAAVIRDIAVGSAPRRRRRGLGAGQLLAALLRGGPPAPLEGLGTADRADREHAELRLLRRQRPAGGGAVERRHQLRGRGQLHLRRPDHPAHPGDLP